MTNERGFDFWLVIDVEATTSDDGSLPRHEMEIIEVGAVLVDATSLEAVEEFQSFVSPMRHPKLTKFCARLTGITDAMLAGAPRFPAMLGALGERIVWPRQGRLRFASWGDYDEKQWRQDCAFHQVPYAMPPHENWKRMFSAAQGLKKKLGMAEALALCELPLEGTQHRGIDDARNIAKLAPWVLGTRRASFGTCAS